MERYIAESDMTIKQIDVSKVATMAFATGQAGKDEVLGGSDEAFSRALGEYTADIIKPNTADCGDDRRTIRLADGTDDPDVLRRRVVPQLFGGLGLATTKALVAANAVVVKDAKSMWEAYEKTSKLLLGLGENDGGHEDCGASKSVKSSVEGEIDIVDLTLTLGLLVPSDTLESLVRGNIINKRRKLEDGFYNGWEPEKHADFLSERFPQNFSYLAVDKDHHAGGHHASGVYVLTEEGHGFAKNAFIDDTGREAFCVTLHKMKQLAHMLGTTPEEREAILVAFADDTLHVGSGIVVPSMPVFAETS